MTWDSASRDPSVGAGQPKVAAGPRVLAGLGTPLGAVELGRAFEKSGQLPLQRSGLVAQMFGSITWGVIGAAQACLAQLIDYTKTRELFGKPLAATQAIQLRLAEMARKITTAQLLSHQLGRLKDQGKMQPPQVSLAKWNNCRMALDVARDCRDMLGGSGISAEYVPIRHALNLESVITYEGTETIHQLTIGRELTGINAF